MTKAFEGIRVIDFSQVLAGPFAAGHDAGLVLPGWPIIARDHLYLRIPCWTLFALVAVSTALLYHRDRRKPQPCD